MNCFSAGDVGLHFLHPQTHCLSPDSSHCPNLSLLRFGGDILQEFTYTREILKEKCFCRQPNLPSPWGPAVGLTEDTHIFLRLQQDPAGLCQPQSLPGTNGMNLVRNSVSCPSQHEPGIRDMQVLVPICCLDDVFLRSAIFKALMLQISCQVE